MEQSELRRYLVKGLAVLLAGGLVLPVRPAAAQVTAEAVRRAIERGRDFLLRQQRGDGSWPDSSHPDGGVTSLVMLALLESGVKPTDPRIDLGLRYLRTLRPGRDNVLTNSNTYVVSLQTMVFCLARPRDDLARIKQNVLWLEDTQIKNGPTAGMWGYGYNSRGDNSCTQFALLGLREAAELQGELHVEISPDVWRRSREHFSKPGTGWGYENDGPTGSMTVAGISSLIICGLRLHEGEESIRNGVIEKCGHWQQNTRLADGLDWMGENFSVTTNPGKGTAHLYYLYGLERAARLSGQRFFIDRRQNRVYDWYRMGAELLVRTQKPGGLWEGTGLDGNELIATSFALLFLSKGRWPVLVNKLRHDSVDPAARDDWNNDRDDVRKLTEHISKHWERRMTWQIVDAKVSGPDQVARRVEDLLQAPVLFITGHAAPVFDAHEKQVLKGYVDQGGFIFAEACCSRKEFADGIAAVFKELFPELPLKKLSADHAIWKADYSLQPADSIEGIDVGCRTSVVLSREDLSCYWQQSDNPTLDVADQVTAVRATRLGTNVLAYATGKELLMDKLDARKVVALGASDPANRWVLQIGKLKHGGDWNVAPLAVQNLMASLRDNLKMNVAPEQRELTPLDENLIRFPFLYMHGRSQFSFTDEQIARLREHLDRGGTLLADACCGREPFDTAFRAFAAKLLPDAKLQDIPVSDELFGASQGGDPLGYDLKRVQFTKAMAVAEGEPALEGMQLDGRWAVIYSKYDIGCALERHQGSDCRGYTHASAVKIATNVILYALLR